MKIKLSEFLKSKKSITVLLIIGIAGMLLIALSGLTANEEDKESTEDLTETQYCLMLEEKVEKIVSGITGDKNAVAVVTLDTGVKYYYADETESKEGNQTAENSQSYIKIKTADGGEAAVLVNSKMPEVRGVAVVCKTDAETAKQVEAAITAALNITKKRISVTLKKEG